MIHYASQVVCRVATGCPLKCHLGQCVITKQGAHCKCPFMYDGENCEHYICSQHCKNKGMCFPDLLSARPEGSPPPLKVNLLYFVIPQNQILRTTSFLIN